MGFRMLLLARLLLTFAVLLPTTHATASDEAAWEALRQPGAIAIMRHALAPGTGDPSNFALGDCSTQRNLDDRGRDQARAIGQAFKDRGIEIDRVITSQWCRCRETAALLDIGPVEDLPALNSFFQNRSTRDRQTADVKAFLETLPEGERVMMVTHQVNISALAGRPTASGQILVLKRRYDGSIEVLGDILIR
jgi:phosphohistidine phosphatase SixA